MTFRHTPSLKALQSFEAAARLQSLTRAAAELNVSVPAIAFQVRQVEEGLGRKLIRRSGRSVEITPEGMMLALELREGFGAIHQAIARFKSAPRSRNVVTVSALSSFASLWLLPRLPDFSARFPEIDVRLSTSERRIDLVSEGVDCAIRSGDGAWPGLAADALFPQLLAPLCHWTYVRHHGRPESPSDLAERQLIVNSARPGEWSEWFRAAGIERPDPLGAQFVEGRELVAGAVSSGLGIGLLDISLVEREVERADMVRLFPEVLRTGWSHWLVYPADHEPSAACREFIQWLTSAARGSE